MAALSKPVKRTKHQLIHEDGWHTLDCDAARRKEEANSWQVGTCALPRDVAEHRVEASSCVMGESLRKGTLRACSRSAFAAVPLLAPSSRVARGRERDSRAHHALLARSQLGRRYFAPLARSFDRRALAARAQPGRSAPLDRSLGATHSPLPRTARAPHSRAARAPVGRSSEHTPESTARRARPTVRRPARRRNDVRGSGGRRGRLRRRHLRRWQPGGCAS